MKELINELQTKIDLLYFTLTREGRTIEIDKQMRIEISELEQAKEIILKYF